MSLFAAGYSFPLPMGSLLTTILEVLLAPMLLGPWTRVALVRGFGEGRCGRLQPLFPAVSLMAMQAIIFLIFFSKADMIVGKWATVLLLLAPNAVFIAVTILVLTWLDKRLGLGYGDNMAVVFTSTGKNNGTAVAIASMAFSPMVAIPAATMPIFQILLMVAYLKLAGQVRRYFAKAAPEGSGAGERLPSASARVARVELVGAGCADCSRLEALVREVASEAGLGLELEYLTDARAVTAYGAERPGLVVDGVLEASGRVPAKAEVAAWLGLSGSP
jgi:hypothetical protein